jgi:hypothetical protein
MQSGSMLYELYDLQLPYYATGQYANQFMSAETFIQTDLMVVKFLNLGDIASARKFINENEFILSSFISPNSDGLYTVCRFEEPVTDLYQLRWICENSYRTQKFHFMETFCTPVVELGFPPCYDPELYLNPSAKGIPGHKPEIPLSIN